MSFVQTRSLVEKLNVLGYPETVSIDSFRSPNFQLVAELVQWLITRLDPTASIYNQTGSENDRVIFIKTITLFLFTKANVRVNPRKLYMADMNCVGELEKIVNVLFAAKKTLDRPNETRDVSSILAKLKRCRELAVSVTEQGNRLAELFEKEPANQQARQGVIANAVEVTQIAPAVNEALENMKKQIEATQKATENSVLDQGNLKAKIDKKRGELDRMEKRMRNMNGIRPPYMDEYEKIEAELAKNYQIYVEKFRHLGYLEQQLEQHHQEEFYHQKETQENLKEMQKQLQEEEFFLMRGETDYNQFHEEELEDDDEDGFGASENEQEEEDQEEEKEFSGRRGVHVAQMGHFDQGSQDFDEEHGSDSDNDF